MLVSWTMGRHCLCDHACVMCAPANDRAERARAHECVAWVPCAARVWATAHTHMRASSSVLCVKTPTPVRCPQRARGGGGYLGSKEEEAQVLEAGGARHVVGVQLSSPRGSHLLHQMLAEARYAAHPGAVLACRFFNRLPQLHARCQHLLPLPPPHSWQSRSHS